MPLSPVPVKMATVMDMKSAANIPVRGLVTGCEHGLTFQAVRTEEDLEGRDHSQRVKINFTAAAPWLAASSVPTDDE